MFPFFGTNEVIEAQNVLLVQDLKTLKNINIKISFLHLNSIQLMNVTGTVKSRAGSFFGFRQNKMKL